VHNSSVQRIDPTDGLFDSTLKDHNKQKCRKTDGYTEPFTTLQQMVNEIEVKACQADHRKRTMKISPNNAKRN
jgi:hypothetical protein